MKKKAFTLTELLVVVVIIGVLSAVVLPKFNKVLETRKTTEAEELMAAVRTEQEARCTLDKNYANTKDELTVWPKHEGSNYDYEFESTGMYAKSLNKDYKLRMQSYRDGGICCEARNSEEAGYCASLNKNYPLCKDYKVVDTGEECAAKEIEDEEPIQEEPTTELCEPTHNGETTYTEECSFPQVGSKTFTWDQEHCTYIESSNCHRCEPTHDNKTYYTEDCPSPQVGSKSYTWNALTCEYIERSTCSDPSCDASKKPTTEKDCGCGFKQTRDLKCDESTNYEWQIQVGTGTNSDPDGWTSCQKPHGTKKEECTDLQLGSYSLQVSSGGVESTVTGWYKAYSTWKWSDDTCQWEEQGDCCKEHSDYTEECPNSKEGTGITYAWDYPSCRYVVKSSDCYTTKRVWESFTETNCTTVYNCSGCLKHTSGEPICQSSAIQAKWNTQEHYPDAYYPACPEGAAKGKEVPDSFTADQCVKSNAAYTGCKTSCTGYPSFQTGSEHGHIWPDGHETWDVYCYPNACYKYTVLYPTTKQIK